MKNWLDKSKKILVALTSYPKRIAGVHKVIESLLSQSKSADNIFLYLSMQEFPRKEQDIPPDLKALIGRNGFRIIWIEDNLKSHKKYYYALQDYAAYIVITVDDDVRYASTMIEDLLSSYRRYPEAISARRVRIILKNSDRLAPYVKWDGLCYQYAGKASEELCAVGVGGVLYPPGIAQKGWFDKEKLMELAEKQDDLWLKCCQVICGVPVAYVKPTEEDINLEEAAADGLFMENGAGGKNDLCVWALCSYMEQSFPGKYEAWTDKLQEEGFYYKQKLNMFLKDADMVLKQAPEKKIYICGAGKYALKAVEILDKCRKRDLVRAFIVSGESENPEMIDGIPVMKIDDVKEESGLIVICGIGVRLKNELRKKCESVLDCRWIDFHMEYIKMP